MVEEPMPQKKVSIREDEWKLVKAYFKKHREQLKRDHGVYNPTALVRYWIREALKSPPSSERE